MDTGSDILMCLKKTLEDHQSASENVFVNSEDKMDTDIVLDFAEAHDHKESKRFEDNATKFKNLMSEIKNEIASKQTKGDSGENKRAQADTANDELRKSL
jgi:t-SNARE complex subunit (syntaxin)